MCGRKPWKKWTAIYWFARKTYSAAICGWIRQYMKRLENWWLSGTEIVYMAIPHMFPSFPMRFLMFHLLFCQFLWVFPMFPILGLTNKYSVIVWSLLIDFMKLIWENPRGWDNLFICVTFRTCIRYQTCDASIALTLWWWRCLSYRGSLFHI